MSETNFFFFHCSQFFETLPNSFYSELLCFLTQVSIQNIDCFCAINSEVTIFMLIFTDKHAKLATKNEHYIRTLVNVNSIALLISFKCMDGNPKYDATAGSDRDDALI